jgi:hypothetical protein
MTGQISAMCVKRLAQPPYLIEGDSFSITFDDGPVPRSITDLDYVSDLSLLYFYIVFGSIDREAVVPPGRRPGGSVYRKRCSVGLP